MLKQRWRWQGIGKRKRQLSSCPEVNNSFVPSMLRLNSLASVLHSIRLDIGHYFPTGTSQQGILRPFITTQHNVCKPTRLKRKLFSSAALRPALLVGDIKLPCWHWCRNKDLKLPLSYLLSGMFRRSSPTLRSIARQKKWSNPAPLPQLSTRPSATLISLTLMSKTCQPQSSLAHQVLL